MISAETLEVLEQLPPVVYLPCTRTVSDVEEIDVEYRQTQDGRLALLAYTALDRLKDCCGDDQPWFVAPSTLLAELHRGRPYDLLFMDMHVPEDRRHEDRSVVR